MESAIFAEKRAKCIPVLYVEILSAKAVMILKKVFVSHAKDILEKDYNTLYPLKS